MQLESTMLNKFEVEPVSSCSASFTGSSIECISLSSMTWQREFPDIAIRIKHVFLRSCFSKLFKTGIYFFNSNFSLFSNLWDLDDAGFWVDLGVPPNVSQERALCCVQVWGWSLSRVNEGPSFQDSNGIWLNVRLHPCQGLYRYTIQGPKRRVGGYTAGNNPWGC